MILNQGVYCNNIDNFYESVEPGFSNVVFQAVLSEDFTVKVLKSCGFCSRCSWIVCQ